MLTRNHVSLNVAHAPIGRLTTLQSTLCHSLPSRSLTHKYPGLKACFLISGEAVKALNINEGLVAASRAGKR